MSHIIRRGRHFLTDAQHKLFDLLVECYDADVSVAIAAKTRKLSDEATASRTVARGLVSHGLAQYSPEENYLLLSSLGKAEADIVPPRSRRRRLVLS